MKVLVVFHGMPPVAGRTVVGSGLRAFANGEALRAAGHEVLYCTRHEDLPTELKAKARRSAPGGSLLLTSITGPVAPPGDRARRRPSATVALDAVLGPAPAAIGMAPEEDPGLPPDWIRAPGTSWTPIVGLAPVGGPLGAPGNPLAYTEPHELQASVEKVNPDAVLVESVEAARYIQEGRWTVILDLFAPRLLEQQFQTGPKDTREAVRILDALQRADRFLFSNERQKYFHLPLLALAGVDCTQEAGGVVPISGPPDTPPFVKPAQLTFVAGGVFWPWADLSRGLTDLLACLDRVDAGKVRLYGGEYGIRSDTEEYLDPRRALPKDHERVEFAGMVPIDTLWQEYRRGSVAFDLMAPNPEREINLSFRQIDYLRCGLPIITAPTQVIAQDIEEYGAGWLIDPDDRPSLERLVRKLVTNPKLIAEASTAAQALARDRYSWRTSGAALVRAVETPLHRTHGETLFASLARTQADLWEEHEEAKRLRAAAQRQSNELEKKSDEVAAQDLKIRQLLATVDRLTLSLEEVSRFRTETVGYLAQEQDNSLREAAELQRELDRRELDLKKKQKALDGAKVEIEKLKTAIAGLEVQNLDLQGRYATRDQDVLSLAEKQRAMRDKIRSLTSGLASAEREVTTRESALADLATELRTQESELLARNQRAEAAATKILSLSEERLSDERLAHSRVRQQSAALSSEVASLERDLRKKSEELTVSRSRNHEAIQSQHDQTQAELSRAQAEAEQMLREVTQRLAKVDGERARLVVSHREALAVAADTEAALDRERDRVEAELSKKNAELQRVRRQSEVAHERALSQLHAEHAAEIENLVVLHDASKESATEAHRRELAALREERTRELAKAQGLLDRELRKKDLAFAVEVARRDELEVAELAKKEAHLALREKSFDQERAKLQAGFAVEIAKKDAFLERELSKAALSHESAIAELLARHERDVEKKERERAKLETLFATDLAKKDAQLEKELGKARLSLEGSIAELQARHEKELEKKESERATLEASFAVDLAKKDAQLEKELGKARLSLEGSIAELQARHEKELEKKESERATLEASFAVDLAKKDAQLEKELGKARLTLEGSIAELQARHEKELEKKESERATLEASFAVDLAKKDAQLEKELGKARLSLEGSIAELQARHEKELEKKESERATLEASFAVDLAKKDAQLEKELGKARLSLEGSIAELQARHEQELEKKQIERAKLEAAFAVDLAKRDAHLEKEMGKARVLFDGSIAELQARHEQRLETKDAERARREASFAVELAKKDAYLEKARVSLESAVAELRARHEQELEKKDAERERAVHALETRRLRETSALEQAHARALIGKEEEVTRERERQESVLSRELEKRDTVIAEGERLRGSLEARFLTLLSNAETEAQRSLNVAAANLQMGSAERGELAASLEAVEYERGMLRAAVAKKDREVAAAAARQSELQAELEGMQSRVGELTVQVEQKDYAVRSLSADADKKSRELEHALEQRAEYQQSLESAGATISGLESQRDSAQQELGATLRKLAEQEAELVKTRTALRMAEVTDEDESTEEAGATPAAPPPAEA